LNAKFMLKFIFYGVLSFFLLGVVALSVCLFLFIGIEEKDDGIGKELRKPITIVRSDGNVNSVIVRDDVKPLMKRIVKKIVNRVYYEATIHNPKGDILPDMIDDTAKDILREKIK